MIYLKQRLFTVFFILTAFALRAADPLYGDLGGPAGPVPAMAALRQGTLPGGLRYYILENSLPRNRAYLTLAVNAGSVLEEEDERGLAHFVEHMAFNGTRRFPEAELIDYLRSLGMRFGPEVNAYTGFDATVYGIETPTEEEDGVKRIPEKALAILDDWTGALSFNPKDVDDERLVIMEEYRARLGAQDRVWQKIMQAIYQGSRYAGRLPIGLPEVIENAPAEKLLRFYKTWYRPENMAIILVGDFDGGVLEEELPRHFTAFPGGDGMPEERGKKLFTPPFTRPSYELPRPEQGRISSALVSDPELPFATVYLCYKRALRPLRRNLQSYRGGLIDSLVQSMTDFRFQEKIAGGSSPYLGAGNWQDRSGKRSGYYMLAVETREGMTAQALEELLLEKEVLERYGFTEPELDRAKSALIAALEGRAAEKDRQDSNGYVWNFTSDFLDGVYAVDIEWELEAARQLLPGIKPETVSAAVRSYFKDDDLTVIISAPDSEAAELPEEAAITSLVKEAKLALLSPYREEAELRDLAVSAPAPGRIAAEKTDPSGALIWELSNGSRVILKETANRNNELVLYALAKGGSLQAGPARAEYVSAALAAELQTASGLGPHTRTEMMRILSGRELSLSFWAAPYLRGFQGEALLKDNNLETLFRMLYLSFTQPRIDENGLKLVTGLYRTNLAREADSPEAYFYRELTAFIYNGHPRFKPLELGDIDLVSAGAALSFLRGGLNPADYTFVLAGNLSRVPELRDLVNSWLASIPPAQAAGGWTDPGFSRPGKAEKIIHKGREEKGMVFMGWFAPLPWDEKTNASALILTDYLDIVLTDEIREKLGGVYSISASAALSIMPRGELSLEVYFICDPRREGELREAVKEKLAALAAGDIDGETLRRAREARVKNFERSSESNLFIAQNTAQFFLITEVPLSHLEERPALYRSVTAEQLQAAAALLLRDGPAELVLYPQEP
ncbi:MAG: insulinase family protein [Treponema sp.]|jgi:zinc protease|nr:insulinase family protein [Treponema sp.]